MKQTGKQNRRSGKPKVDSLKGSKIYKILIDGLRKKTLITKIKIKVEVLLPIPQK